MKFVDLDAQRRVIDEDLRRRINTVLSHGKFIMGPEVHELEEVLSEYVGVRHCIAVSSGTDALLIAMMALGIEPGSEVITSPFSFFATVETIVLLGARPVFVDIDNRTFNIDQQKIESAITSKTRAIMPVSLYGQCAAMDAIVRIAESHGLPVIEDAAQSFGATHNGQRSCSFNAVGCTSFFPSKPLGAYGDAGALFTDDTELAIRMQELRVHGQDRRYHHPRIGINGRMDTLQAAVLLAKFQVFEEEITERQKIAERYSEYLADHVGVPYVETNNTSAFAQYTIKVENRDQLAGSLRECGVPTAVHYPVPLHKQPAISESVSLPSSELAASTVISLPMHPYLSKEDQDRVIECVVSARAIAN